MTVTGEPPIADRPTDDDTEFDPRLLIEAIPAEPIAMLPVRIETRFVNDAAELRIRIFPDALHIHTHNEAISPEEHQAGVQYWNDRLNGSADIAWQTLLQRTPAPRAAWIARSLTPSNLEQAEAGAKPEFMNPPIHQAPWAEPPRAVALPAHWIIAGYRGGSRVILSVGNPVPSELPLGPAPDPSTDDEPTTQDLPLDEQSDLPIDEPLRWMTEYDRAVEVGMAVTVDAASVPGGFDGGLDRLIAVGVPRGDNETVTELLQAHRYSEGLTFLRQGTPTNNTANVPSGFHSAEGDLADSLDPATIAADPSAESAAGVLAAALGIKGHSLAAAFDADLQESTHAGEMNSLMWETTWGYFLDNYLDPIVDDDDAAAMREHFIQHVRGRGPLPAIRIGDQPYGILPTISGAHLAPEGKVERSLHQILGQVTGLWGHAIGRSPFLTRGQRPSDDLLDVLESTPHSVNLRARSIVGPGLAANSRDLTRFAAHQEAMGNWISEMVFKGQRVRGAAFTARAESRRLRMPFVTTAELSETDSLVSNYLFRLMVMLRRGGAFAAIHAEKEPTVLNLLARQAAQLEVAKAAARLVIDHQVATGALGRRPAKAAPLEPEFVDLTPDDPTTLINYALKPYSPISGNSTMVDFLASRSVEQLAADPLTAQLAEFITSLEAIANLPTAELQRLVGETLDLCSHRVDAWHTSLASKRLAVIRSAKPEAVHVSGFGWLEDIRVENEPDSLGYVHGPSVAQATTAAILRSGHLAHKHDGDDLLALDLSSERVRDGLGLLEGVRAGQSLAALLGYRFERSLRERNIELAKYILDFRQMAPLVTSAGPNQSEPLEAMAARDVVDGLKLLRLAEADAVTVAIDPNHQPQVSGVIADLARLLDAVSDLLVAESVHQTAAGNVERAAAALDALDRQGPPPELEFIKTPRSGFGVSHRLLVSLADQAVVDGWQSVDDVRASADPRLNAWVSRLLGDPSRYRFAAEVVDLSPDLGGVVEVVETTLAQVAISPLSVIWSAVEGGADQLSELDERIAHELMEQVTATGDELELRILDGNQAVASWPDDTIGLAGLHTITEQISSMLASARPSEPEDFVDPNSDIDGVVDVDEHAERASVAMAALHAAVVSLERLAEVADPDLTELRAALQTASSFGVGGVLPGSDDELEAKFADAQRVLTRRLAAVGEAQGPSETLAAVFGNGFVSLPTFALPAQAELTAGLADRAALLGGDQLAATTWLQQSALVRPGTAQLSTVLTTAELIDGGTGPTALDVVQLPHEPGERWLGLPLDNARLPAANVSLVIHAPGGLQPSVPQAGLVIDEWHEVIPSPTETTGVSMHFDAPGTRAPQTILLAVPPSQRQTTWTLDQLLDTVGETLDLAKTRAVDPSRVWMMNRALPAIYLAANARFETTTVNVFEAEASYRRSAEAQQ
ncbi:MAG: hypothetical protein ACRBK7_03830 [Acidimicrobiales bacterium]